MEPRGCAGGGGWGSPGVLRRHWGPLQPHWEVPKAKGPRAYEGGVEEGGYSRCTWGVRELHQGGGCGGGKQVCVAPSTHHAPLRASKALALTGAC
jgi:hypothetical protein